MTVFLRWQVGRREAFKEYIRQNALSPTFVGSQSCAKLAKLKYPVNESQKQETLPAYSRKEMVDLQSIERKIFTPSRRHAGRNGFTTPLVGKENLIEPFSTIAIINELANDQLSIYCGGTKDEVSMSWKIPDRDANKAVLKFAKMHETLITPTPGVAP